MNKVINVPRRKKVESLDLRMRKYRDLAGMEQRVAAAHMGVKSNTLSSWEHGTKHPSIAGLRTMCQIYNVSADELLDTHYRASRITSPECALLNGYRALGKHGRDMVKSVMDLELLHQQDLQQERLQNNTSEQDFIPLTIWYNSASAGTGDYLSDDTDSEEIIVTSTPKTRKADMVIPVNGDSMEPSYADGDNLLVERTPALDAGEIGVFVVNGESYVKELGNGQLLSHNPMYPNIKLHDDDSILCVGRVIGVLEPGAIRE